MTVTETTVVLLPGAATLLGTVLLVLVKLAQNKFPFESKTSLVSPELPEPAGTGNVKGGGGVAEFAYVFPSLAETVS
jgi:hypothetical protein